MTQQFCYILCYIYPYISLIHVTALEYFLEPGVLRFCMDLQIPSAPASTCILKAWDMHHFSIGFHFWVSFLRSPHFSSDVFGLCAFRVINLYWGLVYAAHNLGALLNIFMAEHRLIPLSMLIVMREIPLQVDYEAITRLPDSMRYKHVIVPCLLPSFYPLHPTLFVEDFYHAGLNPIITPSCVGKTLKAEVCIVETAWWGSIPVPGWHHDN